MNDSTRNIFWKDNNRIFWRSWIKKFINVYFGEIVIDKKENEVDLLDNKIRIFIYDMYQQSVFYLVVIDTFCCSQYHILPGNIAW